MVPAKSDRGYECGREGDRTQGLASMGSRAEGEYEISVIPVAI